MSDFDNLTRQAKEILSDRYVLENESIPEMFRRVANAYADNREHAERIYSYMKNFWFIPATPVLSNGGASRGLPISCFLNEVEDSLKGIADTWYENIWLAARGGGIGTHWGNVRSIGEKIASAGKTSGIIPFIVVQNAISMAISQGSLRRGSTVCYLPIEHPEIEDFIDIRRPTGGDPSRKALHINNAVTIGDEFMRSVEEGNPWSLKSPRTGEVRENVPARTVWIKLLNARLETGEPYILYRDNANRQRPEIYKKLGLEVKTSNLCSEIMLHTGADHLGNPRTGVCCLSSVNLEYYREFRANEQFIEDIMRFLDNVLEDFIKRAPDTMQNAKYSAQRERSVGLGAMGFHFLLQKLSLPFGSPEAEVLNKEIFSWMREKADEASLVLAKEKGSCEDAKELGIQERFTHKLAVAPTASISVVAQNTSPGIEPCFSNAYSQKTLNGTFSVRNRILEEVLERKGKNTDEVWHEITVNRGSVQSLDFLRDEEREVFKTAFETDQHALISLAAGRGKYVCQGQSLNIFLHGDAKKSLVHNIHTQAWKLGLKSLYYCRSSSSGSAEVNEDEKNDCKNCE